MKKNKSAIFIYILTLLLMITEFILKRHSATIMNLALKDICILLILAIVDVTLKDNKKFKMNFYSIVLLLLSVGCIFKSFDAFAFILLYVFIILITTSFMVITKYKFEISLVLATSVLIAIFIIIGLLDILKFSKLFLLIITITSLFYLTKNKKRTLNTINETNIKSLSIFTVLFIIAVLGGVGRYIHSWDEYSYWGYAAKTCINEKSFYSVIEKAGDTKNYPPVSTIWHYIVSSFSNGFSEQNLYIGLTILTFIFMMPIFRNVIEKDNNNILLFVIAVITFPLLFSGAYAYTLVYVDLLLTGMCTSALIVYDLYKNKTIDRKIYILLLVLITLLKPNGFVFAFTIILLQYLKDVFSSRFKFKNIFIELKKYIIPGILVLISFIAWRLFTSSSIIKSTAYTYTLIPRALKNNLSLKLNSKFIFTFITNLINSIDGTILFSFIEVPLFGYLMLLLVFIYNTEKEEKAKRVCKTLLPYIISYITFFCITALSLFVMFSLYEAENLASFGRYLNPINISLFLLCMYKITNLKNSKITFIISIGIIILVGFSKSTFFISDLRARRDTKHISEAREESFREVINYTEKDSKVFVINQTDENTIMPLWYARYYCFPRTINSSSAAITWKVKTKENSWDLKKWGLTDEKLEKHLIDYDFDYIFFYSQTDELKKELEEFVTDKEEFEKGKLFKIIKIDENDIRFELIK